MRVYQEWPIGLKDSLKINGLLMLTKESWPRGVAEENLLSASRGSGGMVLGGHYGKGIGSVFGS